MTPQTRFSDTVTIAFLVIVPMMSHLLFSRLGFNPTDDGFTLAYARRMLEGQWPHRDFIIIRPCLSPLLHAPVVKWGGDYTYWLSRLLVWFQIAVLTWAGVTMLLRSLQLSVRASERFMVLLATFVYTAHYFPIMAWHTIDGLLLGSLGLLLTGSEHRRRILAGYGLLGAAVLCKQSFLPLPVGVLIIRGDWRYGRCWAMVAAPALLYLAALGLTGSLPAAFAQLGAQRDLYAHGVETYMNWLTGLGVLFGGAAALVLSSLASGGYSVRSGGFARWSLLTLVLGAPLYAAALGMATENMHEVAFGLFGMVTGAALVALTKAQTSAAERAFRSAMLVLLLGWSASLSIGYNAPSLGAGLLVAYLMCVFLAEVGFSRTSLRRWALGATVVAALVGFWFARTTHVYREQRLPHLTRRLDGVLPGGRFLLTNPNTHAFMSDLQVAIAEALARGKMYAIVPEVAGFWAKASQPNPLLIDWAMDVELSRPELTERVIEDMDARRGKLLVVVQRVKGSALADGFARLSSVGYYPVDAHVIANYHKVGSTRFFDLYE